VVTEEQNLGSRPQIVKSRKTGCVEISDSRHAETADGVRSPIDKGPPLNLGCEHVPCFVVQGCLSVRTLQLEGLSVGVSSTN
jgi:hypothetical protein